MYNKLYSELDNLIKEKMPFSCIKIFIDEYLNSVIRNNLSTYVKDPTNEELKGIIISQLVGYLENSANNDFILFFYSNDTDDEVDVENPLKISIISKNWEDFEMKYELCVTLNGKEEYFDECESVKGVEYYIDICFKNKYVIDF